MMERIAAIAAPVAPEMELVDEALRERLASALEAVRDIERHAVRAKGKRIRPAVILLAGALAGELSEGNVDLAVVGELIHMATLVHDDVIDVAERRRGRPTVNNYWGNPVAVLFGDYLLSHAFAMLCRVRQDGVLPEMAQMTRRVCEGEIYQLVRKFDARMNAAEYREMISLKTGSLFSTCSRLSAALSGGGRERQDALAEFGMLFGCAYQVVDDCLDLMGRAMGKDRCKDLEGGRVTLPLIRALEVLGGSEKRRLEEAFRRGEIERCRKVILSTGAVATCMEGAEDLMRRARGSLSGQPDSPPRRALFQLTEFVTTQAR